MRIIVDVDGTLTHNALGQDYAQRKPRKEVIAAVNAARRQGAEVIVHSARNMRTHKGRIGKIQKHTLPVLAAWLDRHGLEYDELHIGKPWCGDDGFYVSTNILRPSQLLAASPARLAR